VLPTIVVAVAVPPFFVHSLAPKVREQLSCAVTAAQSVGVKGALGGLKALPSLQPADATCVGMWATYADLVMLSVQCVQGPVLASAGLDMISAPCGSSCTHSNHPLWAYCVQGILWLSRLPECLIES
jgi:hypothetical protein